MSQSGLRQEPLTSTTNVMSSSVVLVSMGLSDHSPVTLIRKHNEKADAASVLRAIGSELLMHKNYVYTCDAFYLKFCYEKGEPSSGNNVQSLHSNCCVASEIS